MLGRAAKCAQQVASSGALDIAGAAEHLSRGFVGPPGLCASMHDVHASPPLSLVKSARVKCHWRLSAKVAQ